MRALVELGSQAMEAQATNSVPKLPSEEGKCRVEFPEELHEMIAQGSLDFDAWTSLISVIEKSYSNNMEAISLLYESFLAEFPLCHLYWKKYAYHKARLCTVDKAVDIFERAVKSLTYCVSLWVEYCNFAISVCEDPSDVRRLFKRGLVFVGKDYLCHALWDIYLESEFSRQQWSFVAHIYIQALRFPTQKLHSYYDNLKKLVGLIKEEMESHNNGDVQSEDVPIGTVTISEAEISTVIKDLQDPFDNSLRSKALHKYMSIGENFYNKACMLDEQISCFETCVSRPFFHIKAIDDDQLKTWHHYLDFIEKQEDFDWAVKLYERCLISCANYPEFWMRYVDYMESKGARELANYALERATKIHLQSVPEIHIFNARYKEKIGDVHGAQTAYLQCDTESDSYFIGKTIKEANAEKRLGNFSKACNIYEKALTMATEEQRSCVIPILYIRLCHLKYMVTGSSNMARDVLIEGISNMPHCKLLLEELIKFAMMHEEASQINVIDSIIDTAISPGLNESPGLCIQDQEDLSTLYLEFVDLCGTIHDVRKAWHRHIKLFPHLVRSSSSYRHPFSFNQLLNIIKEGRENNPPLPSQPSGGHTPDHMIQLPVLDNVECSPEDIPIQEPQVFTGQSQAQKDEIVQEQMQEASLAVLQSGRDASGADDPTADFFNQFENESVQTKSSLDLVCQPEEGASGALVSNHNTEHLSIENASRTNDLSEELGQPLEPTESLEAPQTYSTALTIHQGLMHEFQQHTYSISLESLTLNSQEKETQDVVPMASDDNDRVQETYTSNGSILEGNDGNPLLSSPNRTLVTDSAQIDNELAKNELVTLPCSASYENPIPRESHPPSEMLQNNGEDQDQMSHLRKASGSAGTGYQRFSPGQQQHQLSPQQQHSNVANCPNVQTSQAYSPNLLWNTQGQNQSHTGASHGNTRTSHSWTIENMPQHTAFSSSQSQMFPIPVSDPQAQIANYPLENSQQLEHSQGSRAYNQMLQYHYHQQQQLLQQQYQQQLLQMQQSYLQQQQSYQQWQQVQPLQHQLPLLLHQQNFQPQQQLQPEPHQPQQLQQVYQQQGQQQPQPPKQLSQQLAQQLQPQQGQQQQKLQQYYQMEELPYQKHQQGYQQQAEQGYQLLLQQYRLQQEQGYQQMLHQYQLQQQEEYQKLQPQQQHNQRPEQQQQDDKQQEQQLDISTQSDTAQN